MQQEINHRCFDLAHAEIDHVFNEENHGLLPLSKPDVTFLDPSSNNFATGLYFITLGDSGAWQIKLAFGDIGLSDEDFKRHTRVILRHEIGHFTTCPYDYLLHLRMLLSAVHVFQTAGHKNIGNLPAQIVNQVSDILVDTTNYKKNHDETLADERYWYSLGQGQSKDGESSCRMGEFMFAVKEALWNESVGCSSDALRNQYIDRLLPHFARALSAEGDKQRQSFCELVTEYCRAWLEFALQTNFDFSPLSMATPLACLVGDEEDERAFAAETSVEDYLAVHDVIMPDSQKEAKLRWYDEQVITWENPCLVNNAAEVFSVYPVRWRLGDPVEELDIAMSLQESPIILPGITTRRWHRNESNSNIGAPDTPDLLIALDVSGSMTAKSSMKEHSRLHIARLASFPILTYCEEKGVQSASIVFSDKTNVKFSNWQVNADEAKSVLMEEFGKNTIFPVLHVDSLMSATPNRKAMVVMTDSDLQNWSAAETCFLELLGKGHKVLMYIINGKPVNETKYRTFTDAGGYVGLVRSLDDLYSDWSSQLQLI